MNLFGLSSRGTRRLTITRSETTTRKLGCVLSGLRSFLSTRVCHLVFALLAAVAFVSRTRYRGSESLSHSGNFHAYYINLASRPDRRTAVEQQLKMSGITARRVCASDVRGNQTLLDNCWNSEEKSICAGMIGVKYSHIRALRLGLATGKDVAIFEDDFAWFPHTSPKYVLQAIARVKSNFPNWKMILLSANIVNKTPAVPPLELEISPVTRAMVVRLNNAGTTHGYIAKQTYIRKILETFEACDVQKARGNAIDHCWKPLQLVDEWFGFNPQLGTQAAGFSDIEGRNVNYENFFRT